MFGTAESFNKRYCETNGNAIFRSLRRIVKNKRQPCISNAGIFRKDMQSF